MAESTVSLGAVSAVSTDVARLEGRNPGAALSLERMRDLVSTQIDRLHDVDALLRAVMAADEDGCCRRLARMASATVADVIDVIDSLDTMVTKGAQG